MITLYAQRHGWAVDGLHVEVDYEPDPTPRQLAVRVHLPGSLDAEQAARLRRVAETCPVRRAFQAGFVFDEEVVLDVAPGRHSV
jgi:putative redox protein